METDEISKRRRENFYTALQDKIGRLMVAADVYLNHAPSHEKYALCQQIRIAQTEMDNLVTACMKYPRYEVVRDLDIKHEQVRHMWRRFYERGYFAYRKNKKEENHQPSEAIRRFAVINVLINEIGSMIGGLKKAELKRLENIRKQKAAEKSKT